MTRPEDVVDQGWYWVMKTEGLPKWVIMQADVSSLGEIQWWEVMKDWSTENYEIACIGNQIKEPE